jgi:phage shock protein A
MGYKIRVAPEVEEWAARLNASVRSTWSGMPASREASRMLGKIGFWIAQPGLDAAYQQHFAELQRARRAVADVATSRKRLELQIAELERQAETAQGATGQLTHLRRQYADMQAKEERVTAASRRLMAQINAFKTGTEATKTAYRAAEEAGQAVRTEVTGKTGAAAHTDGTAHTPEP